MIYFLQGSSGVLWKAVKIEVQTATTCPPFRFGQIQIRSDVRRKWRICIRVTNDGSFGAYQV
jgi:hypothetical protein